MHPERGCRLLSWCMRSVVVIGCSECWLAKVRCLMEYEAPAIEVIGSVTELTLVDGSAGDEQP